MQQIIENKEYGGERPLYCTHDLCLKSVVIHVGESALKETRNMEAIGCRFEGKYPFWETRGFKVKDCYFTEGARSALWYSSDLLMEDTLVEAPKMFRRMRGIHLRNVKLPNAQETFWDCDDITLENVEASKGDYMFMHCHDIKIHNLHLNGNYSFQYARNVEIHDSVLNSKDSFWESENVTIYDSVINGEYLAWYAKNLRLVNCHIKETQPLCYVDGLVMENCTMEGDADLAFEYSSVQADIKGHVVSVKNPRTGRIVADSIGEIIIDENIKGPGDCQILTR